MMLHDRVLERPDENTERHSSEGIIIPATAQMAARLVWAEVLGTGPQARHVKVGDHVLFAPENTHEVEIHGATYVILREKELHEIGRASCRERECVTGMEGALNIHRKDEIP